MKQKRKYNSKGFTVMELLVVISIMGIMGTLLVVNFNSTRNRRNLTLSSNEFITNIRKTQSYALSARDAAPNTPAKFYVMQFDFVQSPNQYTIWAVDNSYNPQPTLIETINLPVGVNFSETQNTLTQPVNAGSSTNPYCIQVLFGLPFGKIYILGTSNKVCDYSYVKTVQDPSALSELANSEANIHLKSSSLVEGINEEKYHSKTIGINGLSGAVTIADSQISSEQGPQGIEEVVELSGGMEIK